MTLEELRNRIDVLDRQLVELLNERHGHAMPVAETAKCKEQLFQKMIPALPTRDSLSTRAISPR